MKFKGYKAVRLSSIHMDAADIRKRTKQPHVVELAANIREAGDEPINALTVRASDKRLLCGRDRTAALTLNKAKKAWIHLVECDDVEAGDLEQWENVYRRPVENRTQILAAMVAAKEARIRAASGDIVPPSTQAVKAEARRQVARAAGITPASVKKAEQRAQAAAEPAAPDDIATPEVSDAPAPTLDLLGLTDASSLAVMKFARPDQEAIDRADQLLRQAQTALAGMSPSDRATDLRDQVHRVASLVRSARPESLCPWCKGLPRADIPPCKPCGGAGYVPAEKAARAPKELTTGSEGVPLVAVDGVFMPYEDVRDGKLPAKNGRPAKGYVAGVCGKCGKPNGCSDRRPCETCLGGANHAKAPKTVKVVDAHDQPIALDGDEAY